MNKFFGWSDRIYREMLPGRHLQKELSVWPLWGRMEQGLANGTIADRLPHEICAELEVASLNLHIQPEWSAQRINLELEKLAGRGGGKAYLPAGCFSHNETIYIPSGTQLIGHETGTELCFAGASYGLMIGREHPDCRTERVRIARLRLRHTGPLQAFAAAIFACHAHHIIIEDITIIEPSRVGVFLADRVLHAYLRNVQVYHAGLDGFGLLRGVQNIEMENCRACRGQQSGILLADWPLVEHIADRDYSEQARCSGIGFKGGDPFPLSITMRNCEFSLNRKMGVCTDGAGRLTIQQCRVTGNECEGITLDNGTWCASVLNCLISGNGRRGSQDELELIADQVHGDGLLEDGTSPIKLPGISMDNAAYCRIEHCLVENNYGDGIKFVRAGYKAIIQHCRIWSNNRGGSTGHPHFGVRVGSDRRGWPDQFDFPTHAVHILYNYILGGHSCGIMLNHGVSHNHLLYNSIYLQREEPIRDLSRRSNHIANNDSRTA